MRFVDPLTYDIKGFNCTFSSYADLVANSAYSFSIGSFFYICPPQHQQLRDLFRYAQRNYNTIQRTTFVTSREVENAQITV